MSGKTNELVAWCRAAAPLHDAREYEAVVASGEQLLRDYPSADPKIIQLTVPALASACERAAVEPR